MRSRWLPLVLLLLASAAAGWLLWDEIEASGILGGERAGSGSVPGPWKEEPGIEGGSEGRSGVRLLGLPGVRTAAGGVGRLTGRVCRYLQGAEEETAPLPGVQVRLVGEKVHPETVTDADGAFAFGDLPAATGYAVIVDHPPYKEIVLRGVGVRPDRTTEVGTLLLGGPTALAGEVVDGAGRPVAGARVQVFFDSSRPRRMDFRRALFELQSATSPLAEARAESDGHFHVESLPPGRYVARVSAPGYATVFRKDVWVTADERAPVLRVVLDRGAGYHGRVMEEGGRGLAQARVIAVAIGNQRLDRIETTSGSDGRYRLDSLVAGTRYFVEAWAPGFAPAGRLLQPGEMEPLDFTLLPSGRIEGRVTDAASGRGIEGAQITVVAGTINTLSPVSTLSDADGNYVLEYVSAGPIALFVVKADGYPAASFDLGGSGGRKVEAGGVTRIDQVLESGRAAFGRVTDASGRAVPYATVAFADRGRRSEGEETALTDVDGGWRVEGLRAATYDVRIAAPGFAPLDEEAGRVVIAGEMHEVRLDFTLDYGATLTGTVVDPNGAPVRGARLEIDPEGGRSVRERAADLVAVTAANGRWRIAGVPPGIALVVRASHDAWVPAASARLRLGPGQIQEVTLALGAGASLDGRVTAAGGGAVSEARVRWGAIDDVEERRLRDEFRADRYLGPRVVRTDGDGTFTLDRLPSGRILVKVEREGYAAWYRRDVVVPVEGSPPPMEVELTPSLTIEGTVRDALTRLPVAEAWVYAREAEPEEDEPSDGGHVRTLASVQTDERGRYVLEGLAPGRRHDVVVWLALGYRTEAQNGDESSRRADVAADTKGVDFNLKRLDPPN